MQKKLIFLSVFIATGFIFSSCEILNPNAPQSCFVTLDEIVAGIPTAFNSSCSINATTFDWNFGDGNTSTEANPTHTYEAEGTYNVVLTVGNAEGDSDESSQSVTVTTPSVIEHSGAIESDELWIEGTHLITSDVYVDGAIVTIEPGAIILFAQGTGIYIGYHSGFSGSTLIANGTAVLPITFTSAAVTKTAGDWDYIGFYDNASSASSMQHCIVEYGGGYTDANGEIYIQGSSVALDNSTIRHSKAVGIAVLDDGFFQSFTGNTLVDHGSNPITIYANYAHTIGAGNTITTVDGVLVKGDEIEQENAAWLKLTCAWVIDGEIYVESTTGAKLTIMPGADVRLTSGSGIHVGYHSGEFGTLIAEGSEIERIKFTSAAPDITKTAGDWDYIAFYDGAGSSSSFAYCDISYGGGYTSSYGMIYVEGSSISVTNSTISNAEFTGIVFRNDGSFETCTDNTFGDNGEFPIEIYANYAHTIGSGNTFNSGPGLLVKGDDIDQADVTWLKHNVPYIVDGTVYLESTAGAKLTIEPGSTVKFTESSDIYVGYHTGEFGILVADGEPANRITFTSAAPVGFETPGDWDGIWFYDGTGNGTILDNCVISYGGGYTSNSGNVNIKSGIGAGVPVISNCQIENSGAYGIYMDNGVSPTLTDNILGNNASGNINP